MDKILKGLASTAAGGALIATGLYGLGWGLKIIQEGENDISQRQAQRAA